MAERGPMSLSEKDVKELDQEITCPVCHEHYTEPKLLPCGHCYCKMCVVDLAACCRPKQPLLCPECRADIVLPENGVDQLRTAFYMNRMVSVVERMEKTKSVEDESYSPCANCFEENVEAKCDQCQGYICADCLNSHKKMKIFSGHTFTMIRKTKTGSVKPPPTLQIKSKYCAVHSQPIAVYCYDCKVLICRDCTLVDHSGHAYDFTVKCAPQMKKELQNRLVPLRGSVVNIVDAVKLISDIKTQAIEQGHSVHTTIKQHCTEIRQACDKQEHKLLTSSTDLVERNVEALSAQQKSLTSTSTLVQDLIQHVDHTVESASDDYLMEISDRILKEIDDEVKRQKALDLNPIETPTVQVYKESAVNLVQKNIAVFLCPSGPGLKNATVNKPAVVYVRTVDEKPAKVQATLKSLYNNSSLSFSGVQKEDGKYEIIYTPKIRGRHELAISINGSIVYKEPLFVRILPTQLGNPVRIVSSIRKAWGVAVNPSEEILVTEFGGKLHTIDKTGKKSAIVLPSSTGVAVDTEGNVYVANGNHHSISKFSPEGRLLMSFKKAGSAPGEIMAPRGLSIIDNQLYICDTGNNRIQVFTKDLKFLRVFAHTQEDSEIKFCGNQTVVCDEKGLLYISEWSQRSNYVQVFTKEGEFVRSICGPFAGHQLGRLCGLCIVGRYLFIVDNSKDVVVVVDKDSHKFVALFGIWRLKGPCSIAVDADGFVYVCTFDGCNLVVF